VADVPNDSPELASIDASLIDHVQQFDVDVGGLDFHALAYVMHPRHSPPGPVRLAIVFAGHMPEGAENYLSSGLSDSANALLREGFVVAVMQMPLVGWNRDADGVLPNQRGFKIEKRLTTGHNDLFQALEPELHGEVFRFFLEPIVQTLNEWFHQCPQRAGVLMIGLSGGGWTTHMAAAVDARIDVSIPVAGSLPLYARPFSPGSRGDAEQWHAPLFGEVDRNGDGVPDAADGVCSWLEVYALGALSPDASRPRRQIQVLNYYDSCCFGGPVYKSYSDSLARRVAELKTGSWNLYSDESHRDHLISPEAIEKVLLAEIKKNSLFHAGSN
jgi:hypothetical protein